MPLHKSEAEERTDAAGFFLTNLNRLFCDYKKYRRMGKSYSVIQFKLFNSCFDHLFMNCKILQGHQHLWQNCNLL